MKLPVPQYHSTSRDRLDSILNQGLKLPTFEMMSTHMYEIPTTSTTDKPEDAAVYNPHGYLLVLESKGDYLKRTMRDMSKIDSNLEDAVNRWLEEAKDKRKAGIHCDMQSTVGNQTFNPASLKIIQVIDLETDQEIPLTSSYLRHLSYKIRNEL